MKNSFALIFVRRTELSCLCGTPCDVTFDPWYPSVENPRAHCVKDGWARRSGGQCCGGGGNECASVVAFERSCNIAVVCARAPPEGSLILDEEDTA